MHSFMSENIMAEKHTKKMLTEINIDNAIFTETANMPLTDLIPHFS